MNGLRRPDREAVHDTENTLFVAYAAYGAELAEIERDGYVETPDAHGIRVIGLLQTVEAGRNVGDEAGVRRSPPQHFLGLGA